MVNNSHSALLMLDDGLIIKGKSFGLLGTTSGEICFNTGMTGYQEVFTDPSYFGQVLIMNNVHIGNYGTKIGDVESGSVKIKGLISRNLESLYSRFQADTSLLGYLNDNKVVGIYDIDTRALVRYIREKGAMNCIISSDGSKIEELVAKLKDCPKMEGLDLANNVGTQIAYETGSRETGLRVAVLDFGIKRNILEMLTQQGLWLKVFSAHTDFQSLLDFQPDGFFLSNGPGDPSAMTHAIELVKRVLTLGTPIFGICLGHQLLALANDIPTYKMKNGHRGQNHPVRNLVTGKCEITTQNHGFSVLESAVNNNPAIEVSHINLNDGSIEGIKMLYKPAFSVQYHPEAAPGPHDSRYLFEQFLETIKRQKI